MTVLLAGVLLGIGGSLHCALMCGPLVALLPQVQRARTRPRRGPWATLAAASWHHAGRITVYVAFGWLVGASTMLASAPGWRSALALVIGTFVMLHAALSFGNRAWRVGGRWHAAAVRVIAYASTWVRGRRWTDRLALGALNGLLPCGMLYGALLAAAGFGSRGAASLFMLGVGLGTVPALSGVAVSATLYRIPAPMLRRAAPVATLLVGLLLISRGLGGPALPAHGEGHSAHAHVMPK